MRYLQQVVAVDRAGQDGGYTTTDEPFPGLLWTEDDEWRGAKEETRHVGHDVIECDDGHGEDVPYQAVTDGLVEKMGLDADEEDSHVCPGEQAVLLKALGRVSDAEDEPHDEAQVETIAEWLLPPGADLEGGDDGWVEQVQVD